MPAVESIDDPLLKELLTAFKEDSQRLAEDILNGVWMQAAISIVALLLAVSSSIRLFLSLLFDFPVRPRFAPPALVPEIALTLVLFILSIFSLSSYLTLRRRYSRLSALAEKLGR